MIDNIANKTQEYLNYIKEHYDNVQIAWKMVKEKCKHREFIYDKIQLDVLNNEIKMHDYSKFSHEEFIPYRNKFYNPYISIDDSIIDMEFEIAWKSHIQSNDHHWEKWTTTEYTYPNMKSLHCVHMVIDWIAMGMKFNNTAEKYYLKNKNKIIIPKWAEQLVLGICDDIYKSM